ncbi:hypothetical protein C0Q70_20786 [Pomacea canaliculata]|uniref:Choice-of-anchor I domain-containing protein n=1 Tax=Pomacea canaliculata TaxID=400727 RepID=A0A2T7NGJ3_POMCA|nr:mesenchyme-specific cell surface glycoprotein-like [Pomacea canaliculata]PVD20289.1 hypothetical protein C0Q70_20786 [Pomacea canaliculata]
MLLVALLSLLAGCTALRFVPGAFLKLPDSQGAHRFNAGTASAAAYDELTKILYVVGTQAAVMNIIDLSNPDSPTIVQTVPFTQGFPAAVAVCHSSQRSFLAVGFQRLGTSSRGKVRIYGALDDPSDPLVSAYDPVPINGYDPTSMQWTDNCYQLVVVSRGQVHKINGAFDDPPTEIEILSMSVVVERREIPISDSALIAGGVRQVFQRCTEGSNALSTRKQDLEIRSVTISEDNVAYFAIGKNNAIGWLDLESAYPEVKFLSLGTKKWKGLGIDASFNDSGINPQPYPIDTFYQPFDLVTFQSGGKTYIATADTGEFTRLTQVEDGCEFSEASTGQEWIAAEGFSSAVPTADITLLRAALRDTSRLGQMEFTRLKTAADGYNALVDGYDRITGYGGRGLSIFTIDPHSTGINSKDSHHVQRVYDSGDIFERIYTGNLADRYKAVFNSQMGSASALQNSRFDMASPETGPAPRAIEMGTINNLTVLAVANGQVGGIYFFTVESEGNNVPIVRYEGFVRRGNPGLSWSEAYGLPDDSVGEPLTSDLQWLTTDQGPYLIALSGQAGVVSLYSVHDP